MGHTLMLSKRVARSLRAAGIDPMRLGLVAVSVSDYRALERTLAAKVARIEWQSGGIKMLHEEIATLKATMETMRSQLQSGESQRIMQLEAQQALQEARERVS